MIKQQVFVLRNIDDTMLEQLVDMIGMFTNLQELNLSNNLFT